MKSRWTTYVLLAVVAAVWGVVAWKIFCPSPGDTPRKPERKPRAAQTAGCTDTLSCAYPDPFLKNTLRAVVASPTVRALPQVPVIRREQVCFEHLGTVAFGGRVRYMVRIGDEPYELCRGELAGEFRLVAHDRDSLYFEKQGVSYGVKICE